MAWVVVDAVVAKDAAGWEKRVAWVVVDAVVAIIRRGGLGRRGGCDRREDKESSIETGLNRSLSRRGEARRVRRHQQEGRRGDAERAAVEDEVPEAVTVQCFELIVHLTASHPHIPVDHVHHIDCFGITSIVHVNVGHGAERRKLDLEFFWWEVRSGEFKESIRLKSFSTSEQDARVKVSDLPKDSSFEDQSGSSVESVQKTWVLELVGSAWRQVSCTC